MKRTKLHFALAGCFAAAAFATTPAFADATDDLRAELKAQRARLEALEKKLDAATREVATVKETAVKAAASPSGGGLPKGFSIYGIADAGVEFGDYGQGSKTRVQSGLGSASRIGFKGERKFGDDLAAYFQLEAGVSFDNGQNTGHSSNISNPGPATDSAAAPNTTGVAIFSRNTFVGLKGKFGDMRFGRDYAPIYSITSPTDPFTIGGATAFRLWSSAGVSRFDNGVFYSSPLLGGVQAKLAYSAGMENNSTANVGVTGGGATNANAGLGPKDEGKGWSGSLSYKQGGLFVAGGYLAFQRQGTVTAPATENIRRTSRNLGASYDFKVAKVYGHYLHGEDTQSGAATTKSLDRNIWWLGVAVPFQNKHTVRAVYAHLDDRLATNRDSTHLGAGYEYALDKETDLYAYYARVSNQNGGTNSLCAGGTCQGFDSGSGLPANFSPKSLMLGARYRF
ncbi:MAG: porin [Sulfuritalea sp.]|nr:porin [Sulfuritalea sp.]